MFSNLFYLLGNVIGVYIWVCIIRIFLSWQPLLLMNPFGRFLCEACDPYLTFFRRFSFLQIGGLDFSPILSLGFLSLLKNVCFSVYALGRFSLFGVLIILISTLWQVVNFLLNICILTSFLRFIMEFSYKYRSSFFSNFIDNVFAPIKHFITKYLLQGHYGKEKQALLLLVVFFLLLKVALYGFIGFLAFLWNIRLGMFLGLL